MCPHDVNSLPSDIVPIGAALAVLQSIHKLDAATRAEYARLINRCAAEGDTAGETQVRLSFAVRLWHPCEFDDALIHARRALDLISSASPGDPGLDLKVEALCIVAKTYFASGAMADAMYYFMHAENLAHDVTSQRVRRFLNQTLSSYYRELADFERAEACLRGAMAEGTKKSEFAKDSISLGYLFLRAASETKKSATKTGYLRDSIQANQAACDYLIAQEVSVELGRALANIGQAQYELGEYDSARKTLSRAHAIATDNDDQWQLSEILFFDALLELETGKDKSADMLFEAALSAAENNGDALLVSRCLSKWSSLKEEQGDFQGALKLLHRSHAISGDTYLRREKSRAQLQRFRIDAERSRYEEALIRFENEELTKKNSQLAAQSVLLQHFASTDALTGVANRRTLFSSLRTALQSGERVEVLLADIDDFKHVNDTFGHHAGDQVLTGVATILESMSPASGFAARLGGEEFVVMAMASTLGEGPVASVAPVAPVALPEWVRAMCKRVAEHTWEFNGEKLQITLSAGFSNSWAGDTEDSLLMRADAAMYAAKRAGKNRVEIAAQESLVRRGVRAPDAGSV